MSSKTVLILAATAMVAAVLVPLGFITAGASTTACGTSCTSPYNESEGSGEVLTVSGTSVELAAASTTSSAQDWTVENEGDVANAVSAGVLSAKLNMLYSTDPVVEYQYAPAGAPSGNCLADSDTEETSTTVEVYYYAPALSVTLAPCGVTAQSLWILDASNESDGYVDLINAGYESVYEYANGGSDTDPIQYTAGGYTATFAEPAVLTVNSSGKVVLAQLSELGSVVSTSQMWADYLATDDSALQKAIDAKAR
jgi:hypothetical protein